MQVRIGFWYNKHRTTGATNGLHVPYLPTRGPQGKANELVISERTVRSHVSNILSKLHLANRTQAAPYALKEGLASLNEASRLM